MNLMSVTIYHNPRCSKSRQTLALLEGRGVDARIVEYLNEPPSAEELKAILAKLGLGPRDVIRRGESVYKELELDDPSLTDDALITAMAGNPARRGRPRS